MTTHLYINGQFIPGAGSVFTRLDPTDQKEIWRAPAAGVEQVAHAVDAAARAAPAWSRLTIEQRAAFLDAFGKRITAHAAEFQNTISLETGKPLWESKTEVDALHRKIALTLQAHKLRQSPSVATTPTQTAATRYKPLGIAAVLGPFNLPAHLPNGQILPALLAGNTIVFKPSELTPNTGALYAQCWHETNLPPGVFNLVHGGREQGAALATHEKINAVYFTGSHAGGVALNTALAAHPEKLLALEMGGNNPLVVAAVKNLDAAAYNIVQSAFITAGQRCTCARRLIQIDSLETDRLLERLVALTKTLRVAPFTDTPEPFIGPVISPNAAQRLLEAQTQLLAQDARTLLPMQLLQPGSGLLTPGILDVTAVKDRRDEELFGPLLQVIRVKEFDAAIAEANNTRFGLAAALLSDDRALWDRFAAEINAGILNWNKPTTGAAGDLPFGGIGASGNHRPAGFFAIDFCSDPVASIESPTLELPATLSPGISL